MNHAMADTQLKMGEMISEHGSKNDKTKMVIFNHD